MSGDDARVREPARSGAPSQGASAVPDVGAPEISDKRAFGALLHAHRKLSERSLTNVASRLDTDVVTLAEIEHGVRPPPDNFMFDWKLREIFPALHQPALDAARAQTARAFEAMHARTRTIRTDLLCVKVGKAIPVAGQEVPDLLLTCQSEDETRDLRRVDRARARQIYDEDARRIVDGLRASLPKATLDRVLATLLLDRASELRISREAASSRSRPKSEDAAGADREATRARGEEGQAQSSAEPAGIDAEGASPHHLVHHPDVHRVCSVPKCNGRPLLSGRCPEHA